MLSGDDVCDMLDSCAATIDETLKRRLIGLELHIGDLLWALEPCLYLEKRLLKLVQSDDVEIGFYTSHLPGAEDNQVSCYLEIDLGDHFINLTLSENATQVTIHKHRSDGKDFKDIVFPTVNLSLNLWFVAYDKLMEREGKESLDQIFREVTGEPAHPKPSYVRFMPQP